jgi:hypothetical protein
MGVEMEGGKPGWNDAMNGLPGLFGSGMSETFELKRLVDFICDNITLVEELALPTEIYRLLINIAGMVSIAAKDGLDDFIYWDRVTMLREQFRDQVRFGTEGSEQKVNTKDLLAIFSSFLAKLDYGIERACAYGEGIVPTYFTYRAVEFEAVLDENGLKVISGYGLPKAVVKAFEVLPLPAFLEGPAKMLPTLKSSPAARNLYQKVKESELFDQKLGMYKTSVPIEHISMENGRIRAFTAGWLERESIFLHMEYKYLLSLLRTGLYEQFYQDIKTAMVVFRDPKEYGRSILENSSFLASSMNPNEEIHGRGFVARLSGSTTEAISIWITMFLGDRIFTYEDGSLKLCFEPKLSDWMFDENGCASFTMFSSCKVTYVNPSRKATYGDGAAVIRRIEVVDTKEIIDGNMVCGALAEKLRDGKVKELVVYME